MTDASELWREHLLLTITGTPKPLLANAITALREAPAWHGVLSYDQFAMETVIERCAAVGLQDPRVVSARVVDRMTTC